MANVPQKVLDLVEIFERNAHDYLSERFNEAMLRQQFINPLFKALGWDMDNEQGHAEAYKDVIHEASLKIGAETKAPDYCFRIGGTPKFYLEAKKPAVNIKDDPAPAFQLRRYGWSKKLPLSILTDFEEFAVYDCRVRPAHTDKASAARILYLRYTDFAKDWEQIAGVFAHDAILKGSFDKYADSKKAKRGTATVDAAFLEEIESWRLELAKNLASRNDQLSTRELNYAVQITIDRIIFLRMCEDRGIEAYGQLRAMLGHAGIYTELCKLYEKADQRYNSGLFHFGKDPDRAEAPDAWTPKLKIDDKVLKLIFKGLYYPDSPYEFSVLPAEILGQVYEQFLGKVIRLTASHQAKVEEKPEVKKAGGVYYTPTYIVDYIVQHTVGHLLEDKTPRQAIKLRILDPACGSGSFLLGAYQFLLKWHLDKYTKDGPDKHKKELFQAPGGDWRLTSAERKRILVNNIYGVDIDPQAVEVTKLSLLLKVLEGESHETLNQQLLLFHERALPDLASNIKCGNSLIGPDFYEGQQPMLYDDEEKYRINVFDWHAAFPEIMKAGGFDAVIGNPPYVRMETFAPIKDYLKRCYAAHEERADLYAYFVEKAIGLLNPSGRFGMIVSNKFIKAKYGKPLRVVVAKIASTEILADFAGANVFHGATVRTVVLIARPKKSQDDNNTLYIPPPNLDTVAGFETNRLTVDDHAHSTGFLLGPRALEPAEWQLTPATHGSLLAKIRQNAEALNAWLGSRALFGLKTGYNEAFVVDEAKKESITCADKTSGSILKPILFGRDVRRYFVESSGRFVIYCHPGSKIDEFPAVRDHLAAHRITLSKRAGTQRWFELQQPATAIIPINARPKIVYPIIANECRFSIDEQGYYINDKLFILPTADKGLLALLNSRLANFYFSNVCAALEGTNDRYLEFRAQYVDEFPMPADFSAASAKLQLESLAEHMLTLHKQLAAAKTPHDKTVLEAQIAAADRQIDQLVYELYGLTADEIKIVEEGTGK